MNIMCEDIIIKDNVLYKNDVVFESAKGLTINEALDGVIKSGGQDLRYSARVLVEVKRLLDLIKHVQSKVKHKYDLYGIFNKTQYTYLDNDMVLTTCWPNETGDKLVIYTGCLFDEKVICEHIGLIIATRFIFMSDEEFLLELSSYEERLINDRIHKLNKCVSSTSFRLKEMQREINELSDRKRIISRGIMNDNRRS